MFRFMLESSMLTTSRLMFGDEYVAEQLFDQDYNAGFVDRHPHQISGLLMSHAEGNLDG